MIEVAEFVETMWRTPFVWGRFDCILNLADWSIQRGAGDPAAMYRGRYSTALGAQRIIRRAGGLAALVGREFETCDWIRADSAKAGDIGIVPVIAPTGPAETGALCLGDRWAVLGMAGVLVTAAEPHAVWRPPCRKS